MSYSGPPGLSKPPGASSLPPRPPPSIVGGGFKSSFSPAVSAAPSYSAAPTSSNAGSSAYSAPSQYGPPPSSYGGYPHAAPVRGSSAGGYNGQSVSYNKNNNTSTYPGYAQPPQSYGAPASTNSYATPPAIRNPFPTPGNAAAAAAAAAATASTGPGGYYNNNRHDPNFDAEEAAQIAQWQSAYAMPREPLDANSVPLETGSRIGASKYGPTIGPTFNAEAAAKAAQEVVIAEAAPKQQTVYREGGGKKWADDSLMEWDPAHIRLFVGNLAGETTDDSLLKAFQRWTSAQKAKVIRDKRTNKSKGFGFVSFSDPDDFFQAAKEMNGKYIQSHPVVVKRATTEIKPAAVKQHDKHRGKKGGGNKNKSGNGVGQDGGYEPHLGAVGGGIVKPGQKTKGGLKMLG